MALTKEQIKEFENDEKEATSFYDFYSLARQIAEGDKKWAKKVYGKAEKKAEDSDDFSSLAGSIYEELGDKEWTKKVYEKAGKKAQDSSELRDLAERILGNLDDKESAKKVYKKSYGKANHCYDFINLAASIHKKLGDKEWAKELYKKAEDKAEDSSNYITLAEYLFERLGDREWATKVYKKVEEKAKNSDDYESLSESISDTLGDKKWAAIVKKKKKSTKKKVLPDIYFSGPELTYEEWRLKEKDINSVQKLNDIISTLTEGEERTAHLVIGILSDSNGTILDEALVSIEHPDGDDVDFTIKNKGSLIKKPKKGEFVFVYFYYYDHSSYTLNPNKKFKNICLEIKSFEGEAVLVERDYPGFVLNAEDASGGGYFQLKIYCDDDQTFEGTVDEKEKLIKKFSAYLVKRNIIKKK
tara:strand:+ start:19 stop:1260 length:1242 start_codon:yes stop_codon:yes gene_type:complete